MTGSARPLRVLGGVVRRVVVPEWVTLLRDVSVLRSDRDMLLGDVRDLRAELAQLRGALDELRLRADAADGDVDELRSLSARVAEVTDLVTEVVLPLHDREIDVARLRPHGAEPH